MVGILHGRNVRWMLIFGISALHSSCRPIASQWSMYFGSKEHFGILELCGADYCGRISCFFGIQGFEGCIAQWSDESLCNFRMASRCFY